jgi:hypothetical protein
MSASRAEVFGEYYVEGELKIKSDKSQLLLANNQMLLYELKDQNLLLLVLDCKTGSPLRKKVIALPSTKVQLFPLSNDCLAVAAWRHGNASPNKSEIRTTGSGWNFYLINAASPNLEFKEAVSYGELLGDSDEFNMNHKVQVFPDGGHWVIWSSAAEENRFALIDTTSGCSHRIIETTEKELQVFPLTSHRIAVLTQSPKPKLKLYDVDFNAIEEWVKEIESKSFSNLLSGKKYKLLSMSLSADEGRLAVYGQVGKANGNLDFYRVFDSNFRYMKKEFTYELEVSKAPDKIMWMPNGNAVIAQCYASITYVNPLHTARGYLYHRDPRESPHTVSMSSDGMLSIYYPEEGYRFYDASSLVLLRDQIKKAQQSKPESSYTSVHTLFPTLNIKKLSGRAFEPSSRLSEALQHEIKALHEKFSYQEANGNNSAGKQRMALDYLNKKLDCTDNDWHQSCKFWVSETLKIYPGITSTVFDDGLKALFHKIKAHDKNLEHSVSQPSSVRLRGA